MAKDLIAVATLVSLVVIACAPAAPAPDKPGGKSSPYEQIVEKARAEREVVLTYPDSEETVKALEKQFREQVGVPLTLKLVPMTSTRINAPVLAAHQAGQTTHDLIEASGLFALDDAGVLEAFDWKGVFGEKFPTIGEAVDMTYIPEMRGKAFPNVSIVYGFVWNKQQLQQHEVPQSIEDLVLPQYRGRFAMTNSLAPLSNLASAHLWTEQQTLDFAAKLLANNVIIGEGSDAIRAQVELGSIPLTLATATEVIQNRSNPNYPLGVRLATPVAYSTNWLVQPKNATHPNAARLFAAWFLTQGWKTYMEMEGNVAIERQGSYWPEVFADVGLTVKDAHVGGATEEDLRFREEVDAKLRALVTQRR
jgi:iron(III) transport system substrate-binding protein